MDGTHFVAGLTHIDLGWKKSREEMAALLDIYLEHLCPMAEQNPGFHYLLEQTLHYRDLQARDPALFERVKGLVRKGVLEFAGGMASTLDTNVVDGESIVRNLQIGLAWLRAQGLRAVNCAMVDAFGFSPQMPQILGQFGFDCMLATRLGGRQWEDVVDAVGLDGTVLRILGPDINAPYARPLYLCFQFCRDDEDVRALFQRAEAHEAPWTLVMPYTENEVLPSGEILRCMAASPRGYRFITLEEVFQRLRRLKDVRKISGDLNPEFSGTYSLRHRLRLRNRQSEGLLLDAETLCALAGQDAQAASLENCWWEMAYTQFHDILTGSHPTAVYEDCLVRMDATDRVSRHIIRETLSGLPGAVPGCPGEFTVFNSLPFYREEILCCPLPPGWRGVSKVTVGGEACPCQQQGGLIYVRAPVPALGAVPVRLEPGEALEAAREPIQRLETETLLVELGSRHMIDRLVYKPTGAVILEAVDDLLVLQRDEGNFQIEAVEFAEVPCAAGTYTVEGYRLEESQIAEITGVFPAQGGPPVGYVVTLTAIPGQPYLGLTLWVNWQAEGMRLRLKLSTPFQAAGGLYEVPFGVTERRPYGATQNSRGEWPAFRFAAVEDAATGTGLALLNRGVSGVECGGGAIRTTLLRAPVAEYVGMAPDDTSSDHGEHTFTFGLYAYGGGWKDSQLLAVAQGFNRPLHLEPALRASMPSYLSLDNRQVVLSAVKRISEKKNRPSALRRDGKRGAGHPHLWGARPGLALGPSGSARHTVGSGGAQRDPGFCAL
jgi:alpha-mannosidase